MLITGKNLQNIEKQDYQKIILSNFTHKIPYIAPIVNSASFNFDYTTNTDFSVADMPDKGRFCFNSIPSE